ncbi:Protein WAP-3 [Trichinella spiralis]|uniref:Protein WAP-3 n=1 Tax=Trichinella spiralis TaxID=6334 RepID=A0ABR3KTD4_TRISP
MLVCAHRCIGAQVDDVVLHDVSASYNRLGRCPVFYGRMVPAVFRRDSCLTTAHCPLGMTCCLTLTGRQCLYARSL